MIVWALAVVALAAFVALSARIVLSAPTRAVLTGARVLPESPPAADAARDQLAALVPAPAIIVAGTPPVSANEILDGVQPGVAIDTGLGVVGVKDDRDAIDRELWIAAKRTLPKKNPTRSS